MPDLIYHKFVPLKFSSCIVLHTSALESAPSFDFICVILFSLTVLLTVSMHQVVCFNALTRLLQLSENERVGRIFFSELFFVLFFFVLPCYFSIAYCLLSRQPFLLFPGCASHFSGGGGAVKLDSMWQLRLTRPLHVQHTYYRIIYKQNPFNIISRGVQH